MQKPDIQSQFKDAADAFSPTHRPPFDTIAERARRRDGSLRVALIAAAATVVVLGSAGVAVTLFDGKAPTTAANQPAQARPVPTTSWQPGDIAMASFVQGKLEFTDSACPFVYRENLGYNVVLAFPAGARMHVDASGTRSVVDAEGNNYGVEGQPVKLGGGEGHSASAIADMCTGPDGTTRAFLVQTTAR